MGENRLGCVPSLPSAFRSKFTTPLNHQLHATCKMAPHEGSEEPPSKRVRIKSHHGELGQAALPRSLIRAITPPLSKRGSSQIHNTNNDCETKSEDGGTNITANQDYPDKGSHSKEQILRDNMLSTETPTSFKFLRSPFRLTRIRDFPEQHNIDTITLHDILRDPMIKQCWQFNFLFDIDFIMGALDPDVAAIVRMKIVHGFWKADDERRLRLLEQAQLYPNVELITAHMPEPFGTHHSKMMIMLRHDDTAQVVVHTANMIPKDWANLTQGVWRSHLLPLLSKAPEANNTKVANDLSTTDENQQVGSGIRFKSDIIRYLKAYQGRTRTLVDELDKYDFSSIRAAFISSVPSRVRESSSTEQTFTEFGWPGLHQILRSIPCPERKDSGPGSIVVQISSIATLTEKWLDNLLSVLRSNSGQAPPTGLGKAKKPRVWFVFPSAEEVRQSLDGYASGASIHMKIQSAAQAKQLSMLKPMLCHWTSTQPSTISKEDAPDVMKVTRREAHRNQAAPHIKTYIRFTDGKMEEIHWAMLTSANLSQQAWGALSSSGTVRICSYEVGVVVWPQLFLEPEEKSDCEARMVPMFGKDVPTAEETGELLEGDNEGKKKVFVGMRMPYDLPLTLYGPNTKPWCTSATYLEPDTKGRVWGNVDAAMLAGIRGSRMLQNADN